MFSSVWRIILSTQRSAFSDVAQRGLKAATKVREAPGRIPSENLVKKNKIYGIAMQNRATRLAECCGLAAGR